MKLVDLYYYLFDSIKLIHYFDYLVKMMNFKIFEVIFEC